MSGNQWSESDFDLGDDDTEQQHSDGPAALRQAYKKLQKQSEAMAAELKTLRTQTRVSSVADLLKSQNVNPKVAKLIPSDIEATEAGIKGWLEEFGDVFNIQTESAGTGDPDGSIDGETDGGDASVVGYTPEDVAALAKVAQASQGAVMDPSKATALLAQINGAKTQEEFLSLMNQHGVGTIQGAGG